MTILTKTKIRYRQQEDFIISKALDTMGATLRQLTCLDKLEHDILGMRYSPSPATKDIYVRIGEDGVKKCLDAISRARKDKDYAGEIIGVWLNASLTRTVRSILGI